MDRIIAPNSVALAGADTAPVSGTPQYATSGNPSTGTPATIFPAYCWNAVQEELIAVIVGGGLTPDRTNNGQVLAAINSLIATVALPRGFIAGFELNGFSTNTVTFTSGIARDAANTKNLTLGTFSKNFGSAFAQGSGLGGQAVALPTSGSWHIHLITKNLDGSVDIVGDTSVTGANTPAGWTFRRRIMSLVTDGSANLRPMTQLGDELLFSSASVLDVNATALTSTSALFALSVPAGIKVGAVIDAVLNYVSANILAYASSPDSPDEAVSSSVTPLFNLNSSSTFTSYMRFSGLRTNTASQIRARANGSGCTLSISTKGWVDNRGRSS